MATWIPRIGIRHNHAGDISEGAESHPVLVLTKIQSVFVGAGDGVLDAILYFATVTLKYLIGKCATTGRNFPTYVIISTGNVSYHRYPLTNSPDLRGMFGFIFTSLKSPLAMWRTSPSGVLTGNVNVG